MLKATSKIGIILIAFIVYGCGYRPISSYAKSVLSTNIYVHLVPNLQNPEDSVRIKDSLNEAVIARFNAKLTSKELADSIITLNVEDIKDSIIATNTRGFVTFYRIYVNITFSFTKNKELISYTNSGYYDYANSIVNPITTNTNRSNAIIEASKQAIDKFISQVAFVGALSGK